MKHFLLVTIILAAGISCTPVPIPASTRQPPTATPSITRAQPLPTAAPTITAISQLPTAAPTAPRLTTVAPTVVGTGSQAWKVFRASQNFPCQFAIPPDWDITVSFRLGSTTNDSSGNMEAGFAVWNKVNLANAKSSYQKNGTSKVIEDSADRYWLEYDTDKPGLHVLVARLGKGDNVCISTIRTEYTGLSATLRPIANQIANLLGAPQ